ncbi:MAG: family ATPase [Acidimicrobiales bacterium]|nr:family ATPase [Acidimicrobiales bacterium]
MESVNPALQLVGHIDERSRIGALLQDAVKGSSGVLVLSGPPGIGKTALLGEAAERAEGFMIVRVTGVESEMGFGYAGVHQFVAPLLSHADGLPGPQRLALDAALGRALHTEFDPFVVALALLSLLGEAARGHPVLVCVDDAHWLDRDSAMAIGFVARRLQAERVAMLVAVREAAEPHIGFDRLPRMQLHALSASDARALVRSTASGIVRGSVADVIVAAAGGNPLALVELPKALTDEQLDGASPLPDPLPLGPGLVSLFTARLSRLGVGAQTALLLVATEQQGQELLFRRAAGALSVDWDQAAAEAEASGLLTRSPVVTFLHPLVRSAVYYGAAAERRRGAHAAIASALASTDDLDRRAWHLAAAVVEADERVAEALEAAAEAARRRGSPSLAANYLRRAAELTPSPARATTRMLEAARAELIAGDVPTAREIIGRAAVDPAWEREHADAGWTQALTDLVEGRARDAARVLGGLLPMIDGNDREAAEGASIASVAASVAAGHLIDDATRRAIADGISRLGASRAPSDLVGGLSDALIRRWSDGAAGLGPLRRVVAAIAGNPESVEQAAGHHLHVAFYNLVLAAQELLDDRAWEDLAQAWIRTSRRTGALTALPLALGSLSWLEVVQGRFRSAASHLAEIEDIVSLTGVRGLLGEPAPAAVMREAWRGNDEATRTGARRMMNDALDRGQGIGVDQGHAALTLLELGAGRYDAALRFAQRVNDHDAIPFGMLSRADFVEAAVRSGHPELVPTALETLTTLAAASSTPWARGTLARASALSADGAEAEEHFTVALSELSASSIVTDVARTQLLYGEWLRRARRKREARTALEHALHTFESIGAIGYAGRARAELAATGSHRRTRSAPPDALTPQEAQIARLAAAGERNSDIAEQLFITTSTVEYHLRKVFVKLGVRSRTELARMDLPS